jgi:hypothetical protein
MSLWEGHGVDQKVEREKVDQEKLETSNEAGIVQGLILC